MATNDPRKGKGEYPGWLGTAASTTVMRAGRHYVQFVVTEGKKSSTRTSGNNTYFYIMLMGLIRPSWDVSETVITTFPGGGTNYN